MAITLNSGTPVSNSTATAAASFTSASFTPGAGSNKWIIAVGFCHGTTTTDILGMTATWNGNAMTLLGVFEQTNDPANCLAVFAYDIGSSTTAGTAEFTVASGTGRWLTQIYCLNDVPDQTAVSNAAEDIGSLSISMAGAGFLLDVAAVNTDDSTNTNNTITIDGSQTNILASTRGSGGTTEGRTTSSYKTVSAGTQSGANTSPFTDGRAHVVIGLLDSVGGGNPIKSVGGVLWAALKSIGGVLKAAAKKIGGISTS